MFERSKLRDVDTQEYVRVLCTPPSDPSGLIREYRTAAEN